MEVRAMRIELPKWGERTSAERKQMFLEGHAHSVRGRYMTVVALTELEESRGYLDLGYRSVHELARKAAGWSRRQVTYLLQVGRKLRELGRIDGCLRDGSLCWSKVRLLVSVATKATELDWIAKARAMTTDQLEHQVQAVREPVLGDQRVVWPSVSLALHRKLQDLLKELRVQTGRPHLDDESGLEELLNLAARTLGREDLAQRSAEGEDSAVSETEASQSEAPLLPPCSGDAIDERVAVLAKSARPTYIPLDAARDLHPDSRSLPWRDRQSLLRRAAHACEHCGNRLALELHHRFPHQRGGTRDRSNLLVSCRRCHEATHELERRRAHTTRAT
jgi:hypothetical protein